MLVPLAMADRVLVTALTSIVTNRSLAYRCRCIWVILQRVAGYHCTRKDLACPTDRCLPIYRYQRLPALHYTSHQLSHAVPTCVYVYHLLTVFASLKPVVQMLIHDGRAVRILRDSEGTHGQGVIDTKVRFWRLKVVVFDLDLTQWAEVLTRLLAKTAKTGVAHKHQVANSDAGLIVDDILVHVHDRTAENCRLAIIVSHDRTQRNLDAAVVVNTVRWVRSLFAEAFDRMVVAFLERGYVVVGLLAHVTQRNLTES